MGQPETHVGTLCRELGVPRQTLYRPVAPEGPLREEGRQRLPEKRSGRSAPGGASGPVLYPSGRAISGRKGGFFTRILTSSE